jgi:hypothetical protein
MACPYFCPESSPQAAFAGPQNAMLPLGDVWMGVCRAAPDLPWQPDPAISGTLCNLGYARGQCDRFPAGNGPDAVRFTITADRGSSLGLYYVLERDHHPFAHGPLEYSPAAAAFSPPLSDASLDIQARAYITSYLRRRREANGC